MILILLFTAIFSEISIIEDRQEGFLQGVLVAPVPRAAVVLGKVLGGTTLAMLQCIPFLALAPAAGLGLPTAGSLALVVAVLALLAFALTALAAGIAWRLDSSQGFHAVMNLFLIPMWLLAGTLFPLAGSGWLGRADADRSADLRRRGPAPRARPAARRATFRAWARRWRSPPPARRSPSAPRCGWRRGGRR